MINIFIKIIKTTIKYDESNLPSTTTRKLDDNRSGAKSTTEAEGINIPGKVGEMLELTRIENSMRMMTH